MQSALTLRNCNGLMNALISTDSAFDGIALTNTVCLWGCFAGRTRREVVDVRVFVFTTSINVSTSHFSSVQIHRTSIAINKLLLMGQCKMQMTESISLRFSLSFGSNVSFNELFLIENHILRAWSATRRFWWESQRVIFPANWWTLNFGRETSYPSLFLSSKSQGVSIDVVEHRL